MDSSNLTQRPALVRIINSVVLTKDGRKHCKVQFNYVGSQLVKEFMKYEKRGSNIC